MSDYRFANDEMVGLLLICGAFMLLGGCVGAAIATSLSSHEQGVRDALAGKYVVVQLPDGTSVVVENKEGAKP